MTRQSWRLWVVVFLAASSILLIVEFTNFSPRISHDREDFVTDEETNVEVSFNGVLPSQLQLSAEISVLKKKINDLQEEIRSCSDSKSVKNLTSKLKKGSAVKMCAEEVIRCNKIRESEVNKEVPLNDENDIVAFSYFTASKIYSSELNHYKRVMEAPSGFKKKDLSQAVRTAMKYLTEEHDKKFGVDNFVEGNFRTVPTFGTEYLLSFREPQENNSNPNFTYHIVKLLRPMAEVVVMKPLHQYKKKLINIILPLSGRLKRFERFLEMLKKLILKRDRSIFLSVVYSGQDGLQDVRNILSLFSKSSGFHHIKLLTLNETFSRGKALQVGAMHWSKGDVLLFMCDVDVVFSTRFLERCRYHTIRGESVYYPIVFSQYNPSVVYPLLNRPIPSELDQLTVSRNTGFWRDFGYGMTCQYRSDFVKMRGFKEDVIGWGGEDVYLYRKYVKSKLKVVRSPDPGIIHIWHSKNCSTQLDEEQYKSCLYSKVLNEASHIQLGSIVYEKEFETFKNRNHKDDEI